MLENQKRIFGLDLMRAIAILMVLVGHCFWIFPKSNGVFYQLMAFSSFFGVEVFFVLSGFLIGSILYKLYLNENFTISKVYFFLKRRWFRTLPNYFLILLINIIIASFIGYPILNLWKYFVFLQNFDAAMLPFFTESWSLSVEEFAYIVLPIFLLVVGIIINPKNKSRFFLFSVMALILIFICNKIYYQSNTTNVTINQWNKSLKSVVLYRLDSIFIGVLCSWFYLNYSVKWIKSKSFLFVLGIISFLFLLVGIGHFKLVIEIHPIFWNVLYLPFVSVTIACFLPFLSNFKIENSFFLKPITFISKISYSMYLLHYGIVMQLMKHFYPVDKQNTNGLFLSSFCYLAITIILSYLLYRFYEKPLMDLRDKN